MMKKTILLLLLLLIAAASYSQDAIRLTARYFYDFQTQKTYDHTTLFEIEAGVLTVTEEENWTNVSGVYNVVDIKEVYDNELGEIYRFLVEKKSILSNIPPKQYIFTLSKEYIAFVARSNSSKNEVNYLFLFNEE